VADERQLLQFIEAVAPPGQTLPTLADPADAIQLLRVRLSVAPLYGDSRASVTESVRMSVVERPPGDTSARCVGALSDLVDTRSRVSIQGRLSWAVADKLILLNWR
jgi:hypothetical protein